MGTDEMTRAGGSASAPGEGTGAAGPSEGEGRVALPGGFGLIDCRSCAQSFFGTLTAEGRCPMCQGWPDGERAGSDAPVETGVEAAAAEAGPVEARTFGVKLLSLSHEEALERGIGAEMTIDGEAVVFRFVVRRGGLFRRREEAVERRIPRGEMCNVRQRGRGVQFDRTRERGVYRMTILRAGSAAEAAAIAEMLPRTVNAAMNPSEAVVEAFKKVTPGWYVTQGLALANIAVFVLMGVVGVGWIGRAPDRMYAWGATYATAIANGEWWRLLTSAFLHWDVAHLAFNMLALVSAGRIAERLFGNGFFALIYLFGALAAGIVSASFNAAAVAAGASGAVFAVYGSILAYTVMRPGSFPTSSLRPMVKSTLAFVTYNVIGGLMTPNIDNAAHLGGLLGGVAMGLIMARPLEAGARARQVVPRLSAGLAACAGLGALSLAIPVARNEAPRCDSPEVVAVLEQVIREGPMGASMVMTSEHREVRYDRDVDRRVGECTVRTRKGGTKIQYMVTWRNTEKTEFLVFCVPDELPPCTGAEAMRVLEQMIRGGSIGGEVVGIEGHREIRHERDPERRVCECVVRTRNLALPVKYTIEWEDRMHGRFLVRIVESTP